MKEADKQLIIKYLDGTCTSAETQRVRELLEETAVQEFISELSWERWNQPHSEDEHQKAIFQEWKAKANAHIRSRSELPEDNPLRSRKIYYYAAVWIVALLLTGLGVWQWQRTTSQSKFVMVEKTNEQRVPVPFLLSDSSTIYLAAGSTISYPQQFKGSIREISLNGEAFFDIRRNPTKPFIVHTDKMSIKVLGTSFKIISVEGRSQEVAVATGKVSVSNKEKEELAILTPGYKMTWDTNTNKVTKEQISIDGLEQWKNGDLIFERLKMEYIAKEMQQRYGINIDFVDTAIKSNRVSGTFATEKTADQVMKTLALAGKFRYETSDERTFKIYKPK